jgi:hypothetical protein
MLVEELTMTTSLINYPTHTHIQLISLISHTRKQMIDSAFTSGFSSPKTVQISQLLDYYLNLEQKQRILSSQV